MTGARGVGFVLLMSIGVAGMASVALHALLGPGNLPCCAFGALGDWIVPILVGIALGLPIALVAGRVDRDVRHMAGPTRCPECGSAMRAGWRLCPECGYILEGAGA